MILGGKKKVSDTTIYLITRVSITIEQRWRVLYRAVRIYRIVYHSANGINYNVKVLLMDFFTYVGDGIK